MSDALQVRRRLLLRGSAAVVAAMGGWTSVGAAYAANAKKAALVVGNAAYQANEKLKNPVADAKLTANTLNKLGFETTLLIDRSSVQLKSDLDTFALAAKGADIALFFYAGHGIAVENVNYLVPVDQRLATLKSVDLKRDGISLRWVESLLAQANAAVSVLVVDACRNPLMRSARQQGMAPAPKAPHGTLTFFSTAPGALAADGSGSNSDFTTALNRYLAQSNLSLMQVVQSTQNDVSAATGQTQIPWVNSGLVGDVKLASAQKLDRTPVLAQTKPVASGRGVDGTTSQPQALALNFWNENLARLDEQIQLEAMHMDINTKLILEQRAKQGDVMALTTLGLAHSTANMPKTRTTRSSYGLESQPMPQANRVVPYDPARALRYFSQAAGKGFPIAQTMWAELLVESPAGMPRDYKQAEKLLKAAAGAGYGRARLDLLDLQARTGSQSPEDLAKELLNSGGTFHKYLEHLGKPSGR